MLVSPASRCPDPSAQPSCGPPRFTLGHAWVMRGSCKRRNLVLAMHPPATAMPAKNPSPHGLAFAPIKVGVLIDIDMGTKDDFLATLRFGFDEAHEAGVITRQVELVVKEAIGLPRLEAKNTIDGYLALADEGVLCVIGPLITDNSLALAPVIDPTGVAAVTLTGTDP